MSELPGPTRDWVPTPTPIDLVETSAVGWLGVKRDDRIEALGGGFAVRKLDRLLAVEPWSTAPAWSLAAGPDDDLLLAAAAAAAALDRQLHVLLEGDGPLSPAARARVALLTARPVSFVTAGGRSPCPIPRGAATPAGLLGAVAAGRELAAQLDDGVDRVVVPLRTGASAAGVAVGLTLAGRDVPLLAVADGPALRETVDRWVRALRRQLASAGVAVGRVRLSVVGACEPDPALVATLRGQELAPDAAARLAGLAATARAAGGQRLLLWHDSPRPTPSPPDGWERALPADVRRRLRPARRLTRRRLLIGGAAGLAGVAAFRLTGYAPPADWRGEALSGWQAQLLLAAATVVLPPMAEADRRDVVVRIDRYVARLPAARRAEVDQLTYAIEHLTTPLGLVPWRFTRLSPAARAAFLDQLGGYLGLLGQAYRGLRDLLMLGHYQRPASWPGIGYEGPDPAIPAVPRPRDPRYAALIAPSGQRPRGTVG